MAWGMSIASSMPVKSLGAAAACLALGLIPLPATAEAPRPNFLLFVSDDHSAADSGVYGNSSVRTPSIDRLAREGMRFTRAFTSTAMCSASRATLFTGLYPVRHGAYPNHGTIHEEVRTLPQYLREVGYRVGLSGKWHVSPRSQFPFERVKPRDVEAFVTGASPWLLVIATSDPHYPWTTPSTYIPAASQIPPQLVDTAETRRAMAAYYAEVTAMDAHLGRTLGLLQTHGLVKNTFVLYTSDHGSQFPFHKWTLYDGGIRVPFIVRWPGRVEAGSVSPALVHFVDVVPTLLELAGAAAPEGIDGHSLRGVLAGEGAGPHEYVFGIQTTRGILGAAASYPVRSVRTTRWKYIRNLRPDATFSSPVTAMGKGYWTTWQKRAETDLRAASRVRAYQHRPFEELYDLESDPYELDNVATDERYAAVRSRLARRLDEFMQAQGDRGLATELAADERRERPESERRPGFRENRLESQDAGTP